MEKKIEITKQLPERSEFKQFCVPTIIPDIEYFSSRNFGYFQYIKLASDKLLKALQDPGSYMVGLYEIAGFG